MNTYALPALKRKRAELSGKITALHKQIGVLQRDLAKVDAVIKLFDPGYRVGSIKPVAPRDRLFLFKQGELSRHTLDILRRAGEPLGTLEITRRVLAAIGQPEAHLEVMKHRVRANLCYLQRRQRVVEKTGNRKHARWRLAGLSSGASL